VKSGAVFDVALKTEAVYFPEKSIAVHQTTRRHILEIRTYHGNEPSSVFKASNYFTTTIGAPRLGIPNDSGCSEQH
jgi:hypothetical protein